jgi:two-component system, cell cycle sensor histidine kinase and response regulator CckA
MAPSKKPPQEPQPRATPQAAAGDAARWRVVFEQSPDGMMIVDPATARFVEFNTAAHRQLGYTREEFARLGIPDIEAALDPAAARAHLAEALRGGGADFDTRHRTRQGEIRDVHVRVRVVPFGDASLALCVCRDITERQRTRDALLESEERNRLILELTTDYVFVVDVGPGGGLTLRWASDGLERMTGRTVAEVATGELWRAVIHPADVDRFFDFVARATAGGESGELECRGLGKDGTARWIRVYAQPQRGAGGAVVSVVGAVRDIHARKAAELERERLQVQLREALKLEAMGRLAGGVAHDFNNMLQSILLNVELGFMSAGAGDEVRLFLTEIRTAALHSSALTSQLLAFARRQVVRTEVQDLNVGVKSALPLLRRLAGEDVAMTWSPGAQIGCVSIDPAQLVQILTNLVINAREAIGRRGRIVVSTATPPAAADGSWPADLAPGDYVQLVVADNGRGMDAAVLAHVFEPFFTTKPVGDGSGLGLATVYGIVRQNGGAVTVQSAPRSGATFVVWLPRVGAAADGAGAQADEALPPGGTETVLVVEDELSVLEGAVSLLRALGYTVLAAEGARTALRLAAEHAGPIHLVLADLVMPDMDGQEVARRITAARPGAKCLFMSGYAPEAIGRRDVLEAGAPFIAKPFTADALARKVRDVLDGGPGVAPSAPGAAVPGPGSSP